MIDLAEINQDKERAEFEASYKSKHSMASTIRLASGRYYSNLVESAWQGWLASAERSAKRISELEAEVDRLKECLTTIYPYVKDKHVWGRKKRPDGSILNIYIGKVIEEAMKGGA